MPCGHAVLSSSGGEAAGSRVRQELWVTHETVYDFDRPVEAVELRARLRPPDTGTQTVLESQVLCHPRPARRSSARDGGERMLVTGPLRRVEIRGQSRLCWDPAVPAREPGPPPGGAGSAPAWARPGGPIWDWAAERIPATPTAAEVGRFIAGFRDAFAFDPAAGNGTTPVPAFFAAGRGVCQDFARLAAGCLQARGVPVRLVFGYLLRNPAGEPRFETGQPHAWLSTWTPAAGWADADPTTGREPPSCHVTLRRARRLRDLQPVAGRILAGASARQRLAVRVTIVKDGIPP